MTSHRPTAPWPAKMTAAPQHAVHLPYLPPSLSGHNSLLILNSLVPTPSDPHVTKRPGRVTDDTIVVQVSDTKRKIDSLHRPSDDLSPASALGSSTGSNNLDLIDERLKGAARERKSLQNSYQSQQTLISEMRAELREVNKRWKTETPKRPPNPNPPDVIHTGSQWGQP